MAEGRYDEEKKEFKRRSDLENINEIPKIVVTLDFMKDSLTKIETSLEDYPVVRANTQWLMKIFWAVIVSTIAALITAVAGILIKKG